MRASFAIVQDQGRRKRQEDYAAFEAAEAPGLVGAPDLIVLADGMGGHAGGDLASRTVVETLLSVWRSTGQQTDARTRLRMGLEEANDALDRIMGDSPELEGMGCTLVALRPSRSGLIWLSVGDSPMWRIRGREVVRLNADHSRGRELDRMAEAGLMSAAAAAAERGRNQLAHAVAGDPIDAVDEPWAAEPLSSGDTIVVASDGLDVLSPGEIGRICQPGRDARATAEALLGAVLAKQAPNQDNVTIAVLRAEGGPKAGGGLKVLAGVISAVAAALLALSVYAMWPRLVAPPPKPPVREAVKTPIAKKAAPAPKPHAGSKVPGAAKAKATPAKPAKAEPDAKPADKSVSAPSDKPKAEETPIT